MMNRVAKAVVFGAFLLSIRAEAAVITLFSDLTSFQTSLTSLSLTAELIDFETLPDGTPAGAGDVGRSSPETFNIFGGSNTATFSTGSSFVYENFVSISASHSLREDASAPTELAYGSPVAAIGVFALDIDNLVSDAASAIYHSTILADVVQNFDNQGGAENSVAFFGAIATNDALDTAADILTGVTYDQSNVSTPEFTYLDDLHSASAAAIPEPTSLALFGLGLVGLSYRRRKPA